MDLTNIPLRVGLTAPAFVTTKMGILSSLKLRQVKKMLRIMKLMIILLTATALHVSATGKAQSITLSEKDVPLEQVFREIEKQTSYQFFYNDKLVNGIKKVTVRVKNASLEQTLKQCFRDLPLTWTIVDQVIIVKSKEDKAVDLQSTANTVPPPIDIKGRIVNENGEPVAATVMVKGTKIGTTTNSNGEFQLTSIDENAVLVISGVSIEPMELAVAKNPGLKSKDGLIITAKTEITTLNEVIINKGYYKTNRITEVGNVSTVTAKEIERSPVTNALLAMQGRVAGMEITQSTGLPGSGVIIRIRGLNSLQNGNDPLYVIDGVPYLSQMLPGLQGPITGSSGAFSDASRYSGSPLSYINPGDIETIDVLKDADATAIYGTRGANGVVLITTKKGKAGPLRVDFNIQRGWGKVSKFIPWMNTRQYLDMKYEALRNDGVTLSSLAQNRNFDLTVWDTTRYTDWNRELIGGTANYTNLQIALSGGSSNLNYRLSYTYNKQTTVFPGSFGDPKGSLGFNLNSSSNNKKLQVQFSANYQADKNSLPDYDLSGFVNLPPVAPALYNPDGTLNWAFRPNTTSATWSNPLASLTALYKRKVNNLVSNFVVTYQLTRSLQFRTSSGYTNTKSDEVRTNPSSAYSPGLRALIPRSSQFSNTQHENWIVEPQLSYVGRVGEGELNAFVGSTIQQNNSEGRSLEATGFNSDLVLEDPKAASSVAINSSQIAVYKYNALFGRLNYNFQEKYLINLTARRDGTSRFGPGKQFANFWAAGAGWIFSKEKLIEKSLPFLSFGKLRSSYGTTGSDQVGDYRYLNLYSYLNYPISYQNTLSLRLDGLFNTELAWEETKKFEAGLELGLFRDRLFINVSFYRNRSTNQLSTYELPQSTGSNGVPANLGATIQNTGWEYVINCINIQTRKLKWTSAINLSTPKNKLVSLDPRVFFIDKRLQGQSLTTRFVYHFAGVDPATGRYLFFDEKGGITSRPDTAINTSTNSIAAQHPKNVGVQLFGGFQNSISFNRFQFDFLFQFVKQNGSNKRFGYGIAGLYSSSSQNQPTWVLNDRWQRPNDQALIQRFSFSPTSDFTNSYNFANDSDKGISDASFIRLENIAISWNFPIFFLKNNYLQNGRIFLQAQNVFTIHTYKGMDPETQSSVSLPPLRVITFGAQVTL